MLGGNFSSAHQEDCKTNKNEKESKEAKKEKRNEKPDLLCNNSFLCIPQTKYLFGRGKMLVCIF